MRVVAAAAIVLGPLTAFAQASEAPAFDASAFGQYLVRGNEVAVGRLAVALPGGNLATKRGATILALPDSEYTRWWLTTSAAEIRDRAQADGFDDVELPARLRRFARYTSTDADGNFELEKLPRGRYILRGRLSIAFPRAVVTQATANPYAAYGYDSQAVRNPVVFDYSIVWLDSQSIRVGSGTPPDIAFHLVARRDRLDSHRS